MDNPLAALLGVLLGIILIGIWLVATVAGLLYSFSIGLQSLKMPAQSYRPFVVTRRLLALNLCEPMVNGMLVLVLAICAAWAGASPIPAALRITAPMVVLLVPALGLRLRDRFYREQCLYILLFGLARWALNLLIFQAVAHEWAWIDLPLIPLATGLLWWSVRWGKRQLRGPLAAPQQPVILPPAAVPAPVPASIATPAPLDPARAVRCPICNALSALAAEDCLACGLVFISRVPVALRAHQDYTVLRPLGDGGMSSVYLARRAADDRLCVLKTLDSVDARDTADWRAEAAECLRREAALLAQLDHPRVARLLAQASDFLVLEYIAGATLEQRLAEAGGPLGPAEALAYGRGVAEVLCYLAALPQPVVHCDLKPANLILPLGARAPVLVDFGGAARVLDGPQTTVRLERYGTPGYAAPEQYLGRLSPRSDIYGLATTLYHLLTGDDPCQHPLRFPALAALPPEIMSTLTPALDPDPDRRPEAQRFSDSLGELAGMYAAPPRQ